MVQNRPIPMAWRLHHLQNLHGTLPSTGALAGLEASVVHHHIAGQSLPQKDPKGGCEIELLTIIANLCWFKKVYDGL